MAGKPQIPTEDQYINCIRCGLCLAVCPTYREELTEASSPRGRVALARKGLEGDLEINPGLMDKMYACFNCMACNDICPVGIHPADLAVALRTYQEQRAPLGWKKYVFESIFAHPSRLELLTEMPRIYESWGFRKISRKLGITKLLPGVIGDMEGMLPKMPRRPLRREIREVTEPSIEKNRYRVGFFLGCLQSQFFSEESAASVRVLARNGCTVITPRQTVCCGMPALGYGKLEQVKKQAKQNISLFEAAHVDYVVTDCATCGATLKEYGAFLADDREWADRADTFSLKVKDISEFLAYLPLEKPEGRIEKRVTYHDPCHLRRGQGVWKEPRHLLTVIDGLDLVELPEADWCCGMAGTQIISHHDTSLDVLQRKTNNLSATHADMVASGCPACQMQLTLGVKRADLDMQVMHPVMLLDTAYRNGAKG